MKWTHRVGAMLLSFVVTLTLAAGTFLVYVAADAANGWLNAQLGELSKLYETGKDPAPGAIVTTPGDPGGKSYGSYMFASKAGTPKLFFEWCQNQTDNNYYREIGNLLSAAYYQGGAGFGPNFDAQWQALAAENAQGFGDAQQTFTRARFYDQVIANAQNLIPGFDINNYSIALQNVFWSRAVQHGPESAARMIAKAFAAIGGFKNQSESELINAIYKECGKLSDAPGANRMSGTAASKYGVAGQTMAYFTGSSGDVQMGVYIRLNINEPADAQIMLYNNTNPMVDEGVYRLSTGTDLYVTRSEGDKLTLSSGGTDLRLTYFASDYYTVTAEGTDLRLAMVGGAPALQEAGTGNNQFWKLENIAGGYALKNRETGTYLTGGAEGALTATANPEEAAAWRMSPAGDGWSLSGMFYPTAANKLTAGSSSFPIRGTISSNTKITSVIVTIEGSNIRAGVVPNATRYELKSLDDRIPISKLSAGNYVFKVTATNAAGSSKVLVDSPFTVVPSFTTTVTFDANGGSIVSGSASATMTVGSTYGTLPVAARADGAPFVGWFTDPTGGSQITGSTTVPSGSHTLYAHYGQLYAYAFVDRDGQTTVASGLLTEGSPLPTVNGLSAYVEGGNSYTFSCWKSGDTVYEPGVTTMPAANIVFTPQFTAQALGGGTGGGTGTGGVTSSGMNLTGFVPDTSVSSFSASMGATVLASDGVTPVTSGNVGTGMLAVIGSTSYVIVITGDVNGDGRLTITDVVKLQGHVVGRTSLAGAYAAAGDINKDGSVSITDVVQAAQVTVGKRTIG